MPSKYSSKSSVPSTCWKGHTLPPSLIFCTRKISSSAKSVARKWQEQFPNQLPKGVHETFWRHERLVTSIGKRNKDMVRRNIFSLWQFDHRNNFWKIQWKLDFHRIVNGHFLSRTQTFLSISMVLIELGQRPLNRMYYVWIDARNAGATKLTANCQY